MDPVAALVFLRELPGIGERTLARLAAAQRERGESLAAILDAPAEQLRNRYRLPAVAIDRLTTAGSQHDERCRRILAVIDESRGILLSAGDRRFPRRLSSTESPTPILFGLGNVGLLDRPAVSVLASRELEADTLRGCLAVAAAASNTGMTVVCGGMKSSHRLAATAARSTGAGRIIILDRGLFSAFAGDYLRDPFACGPRRARIDRRRTLVLSPFRPEDHASPNHGRRRDRLIADCGNIIFVPHLRRGGEIEAVCAAALQRGKPVLLWQRGPRHLTEAGAHVVDQPALDRGLRHFF